MRTGRVAAEKVQANASRSATRDACAVWWATPGRGALLTALLADEERAHAESISHADTRDQYVTARALLRVILARRVGAPPASLRIGVACLHCGSEVHGKPRLISAGTPWTFSISHTSGRIAVAIGRERAVGIDVEAIHDALDPQRTVLAAEALTLGERAAYDRLPAADRARAMAAWWSRKEAVLKATGDGLAVSPSRVLVSSPDRPPALLGWDAGPLGGDRRALVRAGRPPMSARLHDLQPPHGFVGCVAVLGTAPVDVSEHDGDHVLREWHGAASLSSA